jgi:hypothetical protein
MASHPDDHPDSAPETEPDSPEQVKPTDEQRRGNVEDSAGDFAGTAGTGGENKVQDAQFER